MYSSSPPWCPVLAQFGHSLCWHSPCRNIRPTLPMARGAAAGPAETLLSQRAQLAAAAGAETPQTRRQAQPPFSPGLCRVHPMAQVPRTQPGSITMAQLLVKGAAAHKHTKIPLKRVGEMEERRAREFQRYLER